MKSFFFVYDEFNYFGVSVVDDIICEGIESLLSKKLSVDEDVGKWVSDMEWGIDDLIIVVGVEILFVWLCPLVWSMIVDLFELFSC